MYRLKSPLAAQLELTDACNNACLHCYNYWRYLKADRKFLSDPRKRSLAHFRQLLDPLIAKEVRAVTFTGGEPFLRRDILFDLIAAAKNGGLKAGVNTNAALITGEDVSRLLAVGTDFVLVSLLSGIEAVHDRIANSVSHALTCAAIGKMAKAGLEVGVNMVVSVHNWETVRQTARLARDLGVSEFSATPVLPCPLAQAHSDLLLSAGQVKRVLDDLLWVKGLGLNVDVLEPLVHCMFNDEERLRFSRFLDHRSCSAGISDMVISPEGNVRPCVMATQTFGNLISDGWDKVWGNLASWCGPEILPAECLGCDRVDECGAGCRVAAVAQTGRINGKDPYMTAPLEAFEPASVAGEKSVTALSEDDPIAFPKNVTIREEDFGSVVFLGRIFTFLDRDGTEFLRYLCQRGSFTIRSIVEELDVEREEIQIFLSVLLDRGFLVRKS